MGFQLPRQYINFFYHTSVLQRKHHYKFPLPSKIPPFFPARKTNIHRFSWPSDVLTPICQRGRPAAVHLATYLTEIQEELAGPTFRKTFATIFGLLEKILGAGFNYVLFSPRSLTHIFQMG